jgi:tartrate-resistant acid phosphatase type 5
MMIRCGCSFAAPCLIAFCLALNLAAQSTPPEPVKLLYSQVILQQLPTAYRDETVKLQLTATDQEQQKVMKDVAVSPDAPLALALHGMSLDPQGFEFLLQEINQEPSPENRSLILRAAIQPRIRHARPGELPDELRQTLTRLLAQDSDSRVSLEAAQALRRLQWGNYAKGLIARADKARQAGCSTRSFVPARLLV